MKKGQKEMIFIEGNFSNKLEYELIFSFAINDYRFEEIINVYDNSIDFSEEDIEDTYFNSEEILKKLDQILLLLGEKNLEMDK